MTTITDQAAKDREAFLSGEYTPEQYKEWILTYYSPEKSPAFGYPLRDLLKKIGGWISIYYSLTQQGKENFRKGYALAIEKTTNEEILESLTAGIGNRKLVVQNGEPKLKAEVLFPETLPAIVKQLQGQHEHMTYRSLMCALYALARETPEGYDMLKELFLTKALRPEWYITPLTILLEKEPEKFHEYLNIASQGGAEFNNKVEEDPEVIRNECVFVSKIVQSVGIDIVRAIFPILNDSIYKWFITGLLEQGESPCVLDTFGLPVLKN